MGYALTFGTTIGVSSPLVGEVNRVDPVAIAASILSGAQSSGAAQHIRGKNHTDRLTRSTRQRPAFTTGGAGGGIAGELTETGSTWETVGQSSHMPSVSNSAEYIIDYHLETAAGQAELRVTIDNGTTTASTTITTTGDTESYLHWSPGITIAAGTLQRITVEIRHTGAAGTTTLHDATIWERDLETGDL